jgi:hypothetical protein
VLTEISSLSSVHRHRGATLKLGLHQRMNKFIDDIGSGSHNWDRFPKVAPCSRPNTKEQSGKREWHPSRCHGRAVRQEDRDASEAHELGQMTQCLNSQSLLDLSVRGYYTYDHTVVVSCTHSSDFRRPNASGSNPNLGSETCRTSNRVRVSHTERRK